MCGLSWSVALSSGRDAKRRPQVVGSEPGGGTLLVGGAARGASDKWSAEGAGTRAIGRGRDLRVLVLVATFVSAGCFAGGDRFIAGRFLTGFFATTFAGDFTGDFTAGFAAVLGR